MAATFGVHIGHTSACLAVQRVRPCDFKSDLKFPPRMKENVQFLAIFICLGINKKSNI
jgi:hypothetical protein